MVNLRVVRNLCRDHVFSVQPFRRHLFRCRTFSAQIVSAPIRCSLTVHVFKVSKKHRILSPKRSCRKVVVPSLHFPQSKEKNSQLVVLYNFKQTVQHHPIFLNHTEQEAPIFNLFVCHCAAPKRFLFEIKTTPHVRHSVVYSTVES